MKNLTLAALVLFLVGTAAFTDETKNTEDEASDIGKRVIATSKDKNKQADVQAIQDDEQEQKRPYHSIGRSL